MPYLIFKPSSFVAKWAVVDLVFCSFRLIQTPFIFLSLFGPDGFTLSTAVLVKTAVSLLIALTGIPAAVMILTRKRTGLYAGYACAAFTVVGLLIFITDIVTSLSKLEFPIIAVMWMALFLGRAALLTIYCLMLQKFRIFLKQRDEMTVEEFL